MLMKLESLKKGEKPFRIKVAKNISEQSKINGYFFSNEFLKAAKKNQ